MIGLSTVCPPGGPERAQDGDLHDERHLRETNDNDNDDDNCLMMIMMMMMIIVVLVKMILILSGVCPESEALVELILTLIEHCTYLCSNSVFIYIASLLQVSAKKHSLT